MNWLTDENVKGRLVKWLRKAGHDVVVAPKGVKNSALVKLSKETGRVLLTNDTDFFNTALYPLRGSPGRVILRVFPATFVGQRGRLSWLLSTLAEEEYAGTVIELRRDSVDMKTR
jgi:predicted nuclease of predicted toxin-antitoxin system